MGRRSGLGRGLGAIIPEASTDDDDPRALQHLPVERVRPNRYQPRTAFDDEAIESLAASIAQVGVLQPVLVRPVEDGYELIAGERRWRAAQRAGLATVPAVVRELGDDTTLEQALVENLHREDLNPLEEAAGYQQLIDDFEMTQEGVATRVGKSRSSVANTLRLLNLPDDLQAMVAERRLTAGHARALLACDDPDEQRALAQRIVDGDLNVRQTEEAVRRIVAARFEASGEPPPPGATRPAALLELEHLLSDLLDTRVQVSLGGKRGRLVVDFATLEDLERIYRVMTTGAEPVET